MDTLINPDVAEVMPRSERFTKYACWAIVVLLIAFAFLYGDTLDLMAQGLR